MAALPNLVRGETLGSPDVHWVQGHGGGRPEVFRFRECRVLDNLHGDPARVPPAGG